ncbi:hypothetical protein, partial [Cronobacter malonaticus]|uniref:hypothetical protein n=1 Tax=Cronobacter malonaticus TaxID=413503 RepID=UPI001C400B2B
DYSISSSNKMGAVQVNRNIARGFLLSVPHICLRQKALSTRAYNNPFAKSLNKNPDVIHL